MNGQGSGSTLIEDNNFLSSDKKEFKTLMKDIVARHRSAKTANDADGLTFYGYLLKYIRSKSSKKIFNLGPDKDIVADAIKEFEEAKDDVTSREESDPTYDVFRDILVHVIDMCKEKLALA